MTIAVDLRRNKQIITMDIVSTTLHSNVSRLIIRIPVISMLFGMVLVASTKHFRQSYNEKTLLYYANKEGAVQPTHLRS